jgi:RNA polymerase sigma-70 factor, ECF subfamily
VGNEQQPTDQSLIESAKGGDRKALEALLERHQGSIWRFGMKICRDPEDAKEILQETLIAATRSLSGFRGGSSVSTWLYTIARSFCIKRHRRGKFEPASIQSIESDPVMEARAVPDGKLGPEDEMAGKQVSEILEGAISQLAPMYREVLLLRDVEGLSAPEVGEVLGLTVEAVKSRLHRARIAVREQVAPALGAVVEPPRAGCPDVLTLLSRHLEGELRPETCEEMERHLETCPRCTSACDSLKRTLSLCKLTPTAVVPKEVQASVRAALSKVLSSAS